MQLVKTAQALGDEEVLTMSSTSSRGGEQNNRSFQCGGAASLLRG